MRIYRWSFLMLLVGCSADLNSLSVNSGLSDAERMDVELIDQDFVDQSQILDVGLDAFTDSDDADGAIDYAHGDAADAEPIDGDLIDSEVDAIIDEDAILHMNLQIDFDLEAVDAETNNGVDDPIDLGHDGSIKDAFIELDRHFREDAGGNIIDETDANEPSRDCRNDGMGCTESFSCQVNISGAYECLPIEEAVIDCRNDGRGCTANFACQRNGSGVYECLPDGNQNNATDCRNDGLGCTPPFICQTNGSGRYECLPTTGQDETIDDLTTAANTTSSTVTASNASTETATVISTDTDTANTIPTDTDMLTAIGTETETVTSITTDLTSMTTVETDTGTDIDLDSETGRETGDGSNTLAVTEIETETVTSIATDLTSMTTAETDTGTDIDLDSETDHGTGGGSSTLTVTEIETETVTSITTDLTSMTAVETDTGTDIDLDIETGRETGGGSSTFTVTEIETETVTSITTDLTSMTTVETNTGTDIDTSTVTESHTNSAFYTETVFGTATVTISTIFTETELVTNTGTTVCTDKDRTCDGIDDNCNGVADEDYLPIETNCGVGACAAKGVTSCDNGSVTNSCTEKAALDQEDRTCDGIDDNCNGVADEDYLPIETNCGVGACAAKGVTSCDNGSVTNSCTEKAALDQEDRTCDGIDDNCNGVADEDYLPIETNCGVGACAAKGVTSCDNGSVTNSCTEKAALDQEDRTCDGIDDNCNGVADEDYLPIETNCGVGACAAKGVTSCDNGSVTNSCTEKAALDQEDRTCDGIDDNCNGVADEDYLPIETNCGVGACAAKGVTSCDNGSVTNSCTEKAALDQEDRTCDGIDDNCNGVADEDYLPIETNCGVGACAAKGVTSCDNGSVINSCTEKAALDQEDRTCDGIDDNCNGVADEDYLPIETNCGVGACAAKGVTSCDNGSVINSCTEKAALDQEDRTCDGIDDNCNGVADEDYKIPPDEETPCGGFDGPCDTSGVMTVRRTLCEQGEISFSEIEVACSRDSDGTVTRVDAWGACGGYANACDESGSQSRDHYVCRDGKEENEPQSQGCSRDTDGTVTRVDAWGACGGYANACDESGSQSRDHYVCRDGKEENEPQSQGCSRDTDGTVTRVDAWGACGGYANACDENGSQSRDHYVCRNGLEKNEPQSQGCSRDTDGTVTRVDAWGACGGYANACDENGSQSRDHYVCRNGLEKNEPQSQSCSRDTDGTVTRVDAWGACGGYANACDESGSQSRDHFVCRNGLEKNEPQSQGCSRDTDGTVTRVDAWGACGGYANACDESGSQSRDHYVCRNGLEKNEPQSQGCSRDTDGTVTRVDAWSACGGYANACDESGSQSRDHFVCRNGAEKNEPQSQGCSRDTDGTVTRNGSWGGCGGYANACDESGSQSRDHFVCRNGLEKNEPQSQGCSRDTDGTVTRNGSWGGCGGYANACDESGSQSRDHFVCRNGLEKNEPQSQGCSRDTDGTVTRNGSWSGCGGYANACDESGSQSRDHFVCRNGAEKNEPQSQGCSRDTDGTVTRNGSWSGCGGYANACDESGSQSRDHYVCRNGAEKNEPQSQGCSRDTDGTVTRNGSWGGCGGYANACDESGSQSRDHFVCRNGLEKNEPQSQGCSRDTDGTVTRVDAWSACGGYANACDESGSQSRDHFVCRNGLEKNEPQSQGCSRDTDGTVTRNGSWSGCGGYANACDESGSQSRDHYVCRNGAEKNEPQSQGCSRDTDGTVTRNGSWSGCGGYANACDESGSQSRDHFVCRNGAEKNEPQSQGCSRDTDGTITVAGSWSACGNFANTCDESGTRTRSQTICQNGNAVAQTISGSCNRDTDGNPCEDTVGCRFTQCSAGVCPAGIPCEWPRRCCGGGMCFPSTWECP